MSASTQPPPPNQLVLQPGEQIEGRYVLESPLGSGSQADVWRARDIHLERLVALKVLRGASLSGIHGVARFRREAAMLARLRSANLATIYGFGFAEGQPYFAMELIEGKSLLELSAVHHDNDRPMPRGRTVAIIASAGRGLSVAHAQGIVHRDVKPENIMIEDDTGRVILVDFGIALDRGDPDSDVIYGTPEYIAPELFDGIAANAASDQYGLALVAYEALTGSLPFGEDPPLRQLHRRRVETLPAPSRIRADLGMMDGVLLRALSRDPATRYPTCVAFGNALTAATAARDDAGTLDAKLSPDGGLHVLVVDDDPLFIKLVTRCLQVALAGAPVAIESAMDPHMALEMCEKRLPELVVLDYAMPGMDGVEFLALVRALPDGESVRAVVVSAADDKDMQLRFGMLGVRTFVAKPIKFGLLAETLHTVARANGWIAVEA